MNTFCDATAVADIRKNRTLSGKGQLSYIKYKQILLGLSKQKISRMQRNLQYFFVVIVACS